MPSILRSACALFVCALLAGSPIFAFQSPLSEESVREAYFLGQRRDDSLARLLAKYTKLLPVPESGPHIASISFLTPYALAAKLSSEHASGYSAQQAQLDHRSHEESVRIIVRIQFTPSYGALLAAPAPPRSGSPVGYVTRPYDFWKDFGVRIFSGDEQLRPFSSHGQPDLLCHEGGCTLTGATLYFDLLAKSFDSSAASIEVTPPEGDPVALDFDLSSLR